MGAGATNSAVSLAANAGFTNYVAAEVQARQREELAQMKLQPHIQLPWLSNSAMGLMLTSPTACAPRSIQQNTGKTQKPNSPCTGSRTFI
jgi:hypothetical protein